MKKINKYEKELAAYGKAWDKFMNANSGKTVTPVLDLDKCCFCETCVDMCAVFEIKDDKVVVTDKTCNACGLCVESCKSEAIMLIVS